MNLSCLFHRWVAGRKSGGGDGVPASLSHHAESCVRCAAYTQRVRALESRFHSVRGAADEEFPEGLHAKIMAAVRDARLEPAHAVATAATSSGDRSRKGMLIAFCGAAAALVLTLFGLANQGADVTTDRPGPDVASKGGAEVPEIVPPVTRPGSPVEPLTNPEDAPVPTATRRVAEFTGELPSFLVSKVSKPYESEMELLADDFNAATDFLSACIFVADVRDPSTDL